LDNDGTIQTTVQRNLFQNNTQPGPNGGFDIEADFGLANAKIDSNTFTNSAFVEAAWAFGVEGTGDQISFTNNDESNHGRGAFFYGTSNSTVTGNSFTGASHYAVALFGYLGSPANSAFLISGNTFNVNGSGGAGVELQDSGGTAYAGSLTLAGNQYSTSGSDLSIRNESATLIDATGETFNGVLASGAGTAGQFTIVDTIVDGVDVSGYGLVRTKAGNVYVTPNSFFAPATTTPSVQRGVNAASANDTVNVNSGTYIDDVTIGTTGLSLLGQGLAATTISGAIGGPGSTVFVAASNVTIDGFTITREGNNPSDWNNPNLNTAGISLGASSNNVLISNNRLDGNRTGIDINNSGSAFIHIRNNSIDTNRTGMILRNVTTNVLAEENAITGNFTVGIVFLDASGGTNSPLQTATGSHFNNNNISGNWYGQIVDRQTGGSLPAPGANPKDFNGNWFGTATPAYSTLNSTEPGYAAQIPVIFGGSATAPGGQPDVLGPASANFDFTPFLLTGTDTDVETVPGRGTNGFQGDFSQLGVTTQGSQIGGSGRIQEAIDDLPSGGTIHVLSGNYSTEDVDANKPLTLQLQPSTDAVPTTTTTIQSLSGVAAATLDLNGDTLQAGGAANSTFDGVLIGVSGSHFVKQGSGMLTLTGSSPAGLGGFNGSTSVNNGTLALSGTLGGDADVTGTLTVTGTLQGNAIVFGTLDGSGGTVNGSVTVASGGLLAGSGSVGGANVQSGGLMTRTGTVATSLTNAGTVSPGGSGSGSLSVGSFTQTSGGTLVVDVNNVPPVASDHITVTAGTVALAGTIAVNSTGAAIALFTSIPVITNTGGTTSGHFIGLLNGYFIVAGANTFQVSYTGGGGHDVTLFTVPDASLHTTTYANVAWASLPDGTLITDPNVGPGTYVGYTAFATIQAAIDHTQPAGTILVFAGSYASDSANLHGDTQTVKLINGANVVVSGPLAGSNAGAKVLFNKGSLTIGDGSSSSFAGQLTGLTNTTGFVKQGAGTLTLSNSADDYSGPTRVNAGSLQAGTDEVIPNFSAVTLAGGTLDLNGYWETIGSLAGSGTVALGSGGKLSTGDANTSTTFGGQIAGTGDLVKQGAGALTLTGANTFSGGVDVQAGSLVIGGASTPTANAITVEEGASLGINRTDGTTASPFVFGNAIDGSGTIVQSGSGVTRFTGLSAFQGDLSITKGTVVASADSQLGGGNVAVNAPGALLIDGSFTTTRNITADTTAAISIASGKVLTLDAAILTGGTLNGPGSVSSTDGTVFNGTFVGPNGSLSVDGPTTLTNVTNSGSVAVANGQTAALNAFSNASGGVLTVNGTANASGFTTTGQATVNGTLTNVGASKLTFGGGSVTYIGTTGLVDVGSTGAYASGGLIRNMGAFGNATGTTTVDYGARFAAVTGSVDANIVTQNGGVYAPGSSPGTGTSSAFNVNGGGVYEFELSNATGTAGALSGWDTVNVQPTVFSPTSGTLNLSATPANKYTVRVATRLNSGSYSTPGAAANFDPNQPYAWKFISADNVQDTINGTFNADAFQIDSSAFANPVNGKFSIEARDGGKNFYVVYTPSDNVANIVVNNGAAQRSRLTTITVNFINPVDTSTLIGLGAITLTGTAATQSGVVGTIVQTGASGANGRILVSSTSGIASSITLTFDNADGSPVTAGVEYGSLADYRWQLAIPSQNYTSTLNDPNLRRLFGDFNNDGTVDGTDFGNLGTAFGQTVANSPFDYNVDGTVDGTDFAEFGTRFGVTL
jgi:autotransporter-associated beta strand protein